MDSVKQAFVDSVLEAVEGLVNQGLPKVADEYTEVVRFEYNKVGNLTGVVRVGQGPGRGPRYFEVAIRERI